MKDIKIPSEIKEYEAKLIWGFTARQFLLVTIGLFLSVFVYILIKDYFYTPVCILIVTFVFLPFIAFGWFKPYGISFDKMLKIMFFSYSRNKARGYNVNNQSLSILKNINYKDKKEKKKKISKEDRTHDKKIDEVDKNFKMIKDRQKKQTELQKTGGKSSGGFIKKR